MIADSVLLPPPPVSSPDRRPFAGAGTGCDILWSNPAAADFRLCNNTSSRVGIALGYKDAEGWTTEGWWNVSSRSLRDACCAARWSRGSIISTRSTTTAAANGQAQAFMCSRDKEFTIQGTEDCLARGFDRTGFFEVDTGEQRAWTVQLTEANEQPSQQRAGHAGTVARPARSGLPNARRSPGHPACRQPQRPEAQ